MKNKIQAIGVIALIVFGALFTQSCEQIKDAAEFDVEVKMPTKSISLESTKEMEELFKSSLSVNLDSVLSANGFDAGKIKDGNFSSITLKINEDLSPDINFDFIREVSFNLSLNESLTNPQTIAHKTIEKGVKEVTFDIEESLDLKEYLNNAMFFFYIQGDTLGSYPAETVHLILDSKVKFTVSPLE